MSNARQVLIVGAVDCNDRVNTFMVKWSLGKPARVADEYGGLGIDIAKVGAVDMSGLVESRFVVEVKGASVDAVTSTVAAISDELAALSPITIGLKNSVYVGTLILKIAECIELPQEAPWDSRLVNANATLIEIVVRRAAYILSAAETLLAPTANGLLNPTGSTWPASYTRVVRNSNWCQNPSFVGDDNSDGVANLWTLYDEVSGTPTPTLSAAGQRYQYTGAGDTNKMISLYFRTEAASFYAGSPCTISCFITGALTGCILRLYCMARGAGTPGTNLGMVYVNITPSGTRTRYSVSYPSLPANTDHVDFSTNVEGVDTGDTADVTVAEVQIEKYASLSTFFDGSTAGDYSQWFGAANASRSQRWGIAASSGKFLIDARGDQGPCGWSPEIAVVVGRSYGASCTMQVTAISAGEVGVAVWWYNAAHVYISYSDVRRHPLAAGADGAEVTAQADVTAPAGATYARVVMTANPGSVLTCTFRDHKFGADLITAPAIRALPGRGQYATPLDLLLDAGAVTLQGCYVGYTADETAVIGDFVKPLVAASWSAGAAAADAAGYPAGAGNTVWRHNAAAYTDIDVTSLDPGEYLVLANCRGTTASTDTVQQAFGSPVLIPTTALKLLSLGVVSLPTRAVRGALTDLLRVTITGDGGSEYAAVNYVALLPASRGVTGYVLASGHVHALRWEDGVLYVDDAVDFAHVFGGAAPLLTLRGQIVVLAENATAAPTVAFTATASATPRWEQFPS